VAVVRALLRLGVTGVAVKWPNDLLWAGRKLAGLLLEMRSEANGINNSTTQIVIGVGINVRMQTIDATQINQPWSTLEQTSQIGQYSPDRSRLAALVLSELVAALLQFEIDGLTSFLPDWNRYDALKGQRIQVSIGEQHLEGDYLGIAQDGALQMAVGGKIIPCYGGEVRQCRVAPG
jgi:BirA family biotin operon repressor/biotin-[acetyl-CoA-carboxylase] ligase